MSHSSEKSVPGAALVARTLRGAVRIGDDYWTIEETITLPTTATDAQISEAVHAGLRMYQAQREAFDSQVNALREQALRAALDAGRPEHKASKDEPISEKQQRYMEFLMEQLGWGHDLNRLREFISDSQIQVRDVAQMTKLEASVVIDALKTLHQGDMPL